MAAMVTATFVCRQAIRLRRKLHLLFTFVSVVFVIVVCMHAIDDQRDRKFANRKSPTGDTHGTPSHTSSCPHLVQFERDIPIIWIGGVPRSGTTLMRALLDAHPYIRCGAESRVIPRMLGLHQGMERSEAEMSWLRSARVTNETLDRALGAYILTVVARKYDDDAATYGPEMESWKTIPKDPTGVKLCSKDPFAMRSMQRLLRVFPSSLFILLVRDGRAVADSIVSGHVTIRGFDVTSRQAALADWNRVMSTMYSQCLAVGADRCLPVHYEQLVLWPEEQMRKVLQFVGVRWNDIVLRHETTIGRRGGIYLSQKEFSSEQVRRPINNDSLTKWVNQTPGDLRHDVRSIAPMLDMLGYDPDVYPPDYLSMSYKAEQLLRHQSAISMVTDDAIF